MKTTLICVALGLAALAGCDRRTPNEVPATPAPTTTPPADTTPATPSTTPPAMPSATPGADTSAPAASAASQ